MDEQKARQPAVSLDEAIEAIRSAGHEVIISYRLDYGEFVSDIRLNGRGQWYTEGAPTAHAALAAAAQAAGIPLTEPKQADQDGTVTVTLRLTAEQRDLLIDDILAQLDAAWAKREIKQP